MLFSAQYSTFAYLWTS